MKRMKPIWSRLPISACLTLIIGHGEVLDKQQSGTKGRDVNLCEKERVNIFTGQDAYGVNVVIQSIKPIITNT